MAFSQNKNQVIVSDIALRQAAISYMPGDIVL